jgi:hypothetical protein
MNKLLAANEFEVCIKIRGEQNCRSQAVDPDGNRIALLVSESS